jgi:heterodisulfide reductase subunit C
MMKAELEKLLKSDTIRRCGKCLSCKTRFPRGNVPGYLIHALRVLSIDKGKLIEIHQVAVEPLLDKLGIKYDPEKKYKGRNGEDIGLPEKPQVLRCC